ncbi:MAG: ACP S-malonyltransferase [Longimicrobiales bacterium]
MVGLLFPGQGSQYVGMGRDLADRDPAAASVWTEADEVLGFALSSLAWDGPEAELTATKNAQPAILTHSIAVWRVVRERVGAVCCAAGHSLGEFSAYVAAGSLEFADAVRTVRRRGELMFESGLERAGTMAAILGLEDADLQRVCAEASGEDGVCVPANYNAAGQIVISGDVGAVERAMAGAKAAGARRVVALNVSGAFHSPLMSVAQPGLEACLADVALRDPAFPVLSNVTAQPVHQAADARRLLVEQLTSPVRWAASMRRMLDLGSERFLELGPGSVLVGLLRRVGRGAPSVTLGTADEVAAFVEG